MLRYIWTKQSNSLRQFIWLRKRALTDIIVNFIIDTSILAGILRAMVTANLFFIGQLFFIFLFFFCVFGYNYIGRQYNLYWVIYSFYYFLSFYPINFFENFLVFVFINFGFFFLRRFFDFSFEVSKTTIGNIKIFGEGVFYSDNSSENLTKNVLLLLLFVKISLKNVYFIYNYIVVRLKKVISFFFNIFMYRFNFLRSYINLNFFKNFIIWRPLFKKWSYFGFYATHRAKWLFRK